MLQRGGADTVDKFIEALDAAELTTAADLLRKERAVSTTGAGEVW